MYRFCPPFEIGDQDNEHKAEAVGAVGDKVAGEKGVRVAAGRTLKAQRENAGIAGLASAVRYKGAGITAI